ncbi:MAG: hypothetical protein F6K40_29780 [Okeania sp. SIO3I5]|uniref:class I SAM-dependent methyltransferase n=1 Tax=Okeania sp. SIO3I5 TaxID=2607805 RepID=UPI0013B7F357|nr:hypothetical protein [Okeania sp. SIO3I5]NEQ40208.1 hypothetical protein [Okeania sp. SIO3I5]
MKNQDLETQLDEIRKIDEVRTELKGLQQKLEQAQQSIKELRVKAKEKIAVEKQLLLTGHNLLAKGELEEAIHNYQKAIALQPGLKKLPKDSLAQLKSALLNNEAEKLTKSNGHKDIEEKTSYSRSNPSPRYQELLAMYQQMHAHGSPEHNIPAKVMFAGQSLSRQALNIKDLIAKYQGKSLLDYGSGKGMAYRTKFVPPNQKDKVFPNVQTFWGIEQLTCYDPAYLENSNLPKGKFDAVICTDVLEHCPTEDMPWIVEEIFSFASKFVYANVACRPAAKRLPNGENAHCTVKSVEWWESLINSIAENYPSVSYYFWFDVAKGEPVLLKSETEKLTKHQGSFQSESGFTSTAIVENLIDAVKNSDCSNTPFSNFYIENCFSNEVYQAILDNLPSDEVYKDLKHKDALRDDGSSTRGSFSLINEQRLNLLSNQQRSFWEIITEALLSDDLKKIVFEKLKEDIASCYQIDQDRVMGMKAFPNVLLLRDWESYEIKPHPDSKEKIVTMQFYLPENMSQIEMGTSIYEIEPKTKNMKLFKTYDFKPNSGYAFAVTSKSIHGVNKLSIGSQVRNTMMVIYSENSRLFY